MVFFRLLSTLSISVEVVELLWSAPVFFSLPLLGKCLVLAWKFFQESLDRDLRRLAFKRAVLTTTECGSLHDAMHRGKS